MIIDSDQQIVDCDTSNSGCNGGWYGSAWKYLANFGGQVTEESYPYIGFEYSCSDTTGVVGATVDTKVKFIRPGNATMMMELLSQNRVLAVAIAIVDSFFSYGFVNFDFIRHTF